MNFKKSITKLYNEVRKQKYTKTLNTQKPRRQRICEEQTRKSIRRLLVSLEEKQLRHVFTSVSL